MPKKMIWIDDELENEILEVSDMCGLGDVARRTFKKMNDDINLTIECMNDNVNAFKNTAQVVIDTYAKVVEEERDRIYDAWEKSESVRHAGLEIVRKSKVEIGSLRAEVDYLNKSLEGFNTWKVEQFMNVVTQFNNMPPREKDLLSKLFDVCRE